MFQVTQFHVQKLGNKPDECEDSFYYDLERGKFAIADGASECCFSRLWSTLLTEYFVRSDLSLFSIENFSKDELGKALLSFLPSAQDAWINKIDWPSLKWNVLEKARRGAFASFLGLEIGKKESYYMWRAIAIGDCCLLHFKSQKLMDSFPLHSSLEFGSTPSMLSSIPSPNTHPEVSGKEGKVEKGEIMVLATDAIVEWILRENENGGDQYKSLFSLRNDDLKAFFEELIEDGKMKNDDLTLITLIF